MVRQGRRAGRQVLLERHRATLTRREYRQESAPPRQAVAVATIGRVLPHVDVA